MNTKIKKSLALAIALLQFVLLAPSALADNLPMQKRKFLVTGYYSPLPNQSFYVRGSYEADVILNGRGTNGADGTPVYPGMLAAPKSYPFGTRVKLPGLGVGEVHDRGGAIILGKDYDRIDVWMGSGEAGLSRALNWGARMVEGEIYYNPIEIEPGLSFDGVSAQLSSAAIARMQNKPLQNPAVYNEPIAQESNGQPAPAVVTAETVKQLQESLTTFGFYHGSVNGEYDAATQEAVYLFQFSEKLVGSKDSAGAGVFGPKTRAALQEKLEHFNADVLREQQRLGDNLGKLSAGLGKDSSGDQVYALQQMLWELGYYSADLNGLYDEATQDAVFRFQKENGLLQSESDAGAGFFGKKTLAALAEFIQRKIDHVKDYPRVMQSWVPAKQDLPVIASLTAPEITLESKQLVFAAVFNAPEEGPVEAPTKISSDLELNDRNDEVALLQNALIREGHLEAGLNTGYFGQKTKEALIAYQLKQGIIIAAEDTGAGRAGPRTREMINSIL